MVHIPHSSTAALYLPHLSHPMEYNGNHSNGRQMRHFAIRSAPVPRGDPSDDPFPSPVPEGVTIRQRMWAWKVPRMVLGRGCVAPRPNGLTFGTYDRGGQIWAGTRHGPNGQPPDTLLAPGTLHHEQFAPAHWTEVSNQAYLCNHTLTYSTERPG